MANCLQFCFVLLFSVFNICAMFCSCFNVGSVTDCLCLKNNSLLIFAVYVLSLVQRIFIIFVIAWFDICSCSSISLLAVFDLTLNFHDIHVADSLMCLVPCQLCCDGANDV